jgi:hypothetical protein
LKSAFYLKFRCVEGYNQGQDEIIYLLSRTGLIHGGGLPYVFRDGHAIMQFTGFYNRLPDLKNIDWDVMRSPFWFDTEEDPDRKRRRQAEFLVHQCVPSIAVQHDKMKQAIEKIVQQRHQHMPVVVRPHWYDGKGE